MRELNYYRYRGLCLCPLDGQLPAGAEPAEPFGTPVYLIRRDPMTAPAISLCPSEGDVLSRLDAGRPMTAPTDSVACCPLPVASAGRPMTAPTGGIYVNTAFPKALDRLPGLLGPKTGGLKLSLVGLGDVGIPC